MSMSSHKGAIAEAVITAEAVKLGFVVLRPVVEGRRYDLVIDTGARLLRIQCKAAIKKGAVIVVNTQHAALDAPRLRPDHVLARGDRWDRRLLRGAGALLLPADRTRRRPTWPAPAVVARRQQPGVGDKLGI
jgi:hypothetical protein